MAYQDDWKEIQADPRFQAYPSAQQATIGRYYARLMVRPEVGSSSPAMTSFLQKNVLDKQPAATGDPAADAPVTPPLSQQFQQSQARRIPTNLQPENTPAQDFQQGAMQGPTFSQQDIIGKGRQPQPLSRTIPYNTPATNPAQQRLDTVNKGLGLARGLTYGPFVDAAQGAADIVQGNAITPSQPMGFPGSGDGAAGLAGHALINAAGQTAGGFSDPTNLVIGAALGHGLKLGMGALKVARGAPMPDMGFQQTIPDQPAPMPGDEAPFWQQQPSQSGPPIGLPDRTAPRVHDLSQGPEGIPPGVKLGQIIPPPDLGEPMAPAAGDPEALIAKQQQAQSAIHPQAWQDTLDADQKAVEDQQQRARDIKDQKFTERNAPNQAVVDDINQRIKDARAKRLQAGLPEPEDPHAEWNRILDESQAATGINPRDRQGLNDVALRYGETAGVGDALARRKADQGAAWNQTLDEAQAGAAIKPSEQAALNDIKSRHADTSGISDILDRRTRDQGFTPKVEEVGIHPDAWNEAVKRVSPTETGGIHPGAWADAVKRLATEEEGSVTLPTKAELKGHAQDAVALAARAGKKIGDIQRIIERHTTDPLDAAVSRRVLDFANSKTGQHHTNIEQVWEYLKHEPASAPIANMIRSKVVSEFGVPLPVLEMKRAAKMAANHILKPLERHANALEKLSPAERASLDRQVSEPSEQPRTLRAQTTADMIDQVSQKQVDVGALSQETFDKHQGYYLPRAYEDKVPVVSSVVRAYGQLAARINGHQERGRSFKMDAQQWDDRTTHDWQATGKPMKGITELTDGTGAKVYVADGDVSHYTSPWTFRGYAGKEGIKASQAEHEASTLTDRLAEAHAKGWGAKAIQDIQDKLDDAHTRFLDAREKAVHVGHRDYSLAERSGKMGQERDIANSVYRFLDKARGNLESGGFLKEVAQDTRYAMPNAKGVTPPADWVLFGNEKATGGDANAAPRKWGALANHWIEPETANYLKSQAGWRNFVKEAKRYTGINMWKGNKTIGNGPTYMLNNFMQNMPFLMLEGGTPWDVFGALHHTTTNSTLFQALEEHGTIRDGRQLADLGMSLNSANAHTFSPYTFIKNIAQGYEKAGAKLGNVAQTVDDMFRIALVDRKIQEGMSFHEAAQLAERTFYNPASVTSDIATAHELISPFVKFWYWSADRIPPMLVNHPAKAAAMLAMWQAGRSLSDAIAGRSDEQIKAREANMPSHLKGGIGPNGWGNLNSFPLPWNDSHGNQTVIGTNAWNPGQYASDTADQQKLGMIPQAWMLGGPSQIIGSAIRNHDDFYNQDIAKVTDGPTDFPRLSYLAKNLGPSYLSGSIPSVVDAIRGRQSYSGQQSDVPTALPRLLGFKTQPFDQDARLQQLIGQQKGDQQQISSALHRAVVMQSRNPGDAAYWQGEIERLTAMLGEHAQANGDNLTRAQGGTPQPFTPLAPIGKGATVQQLLARPGN